ncbi:DUF2121 domain-containing protein [Methanophagales archaeon]|nr:MAG: DUF2121 domain-containing protein [Methanophagales archaeon]
MKPLCYRCHVASWTGQVTSFEQGELKLRRVYSVPGFYLIIDVVKGKVVMTEEDGSAFVILGNKITKREASATIKKEWNGRLNMEGDGAN